MIFEVSKRPRCSWLLMIATFALVFCGHALASVEVAQQLQDPNPKEREKAARQLGQEDDPANVVILAKAIQDKDEKVRMAVVKSLIHLGSPASLEPLARSVQDGIPEIRWLSIDGIVNFYMPGFIDSGFGSYFRSIGSKVGSLFSDVDTVVVTEDVKVDPAAIHALVLSMNGAPDTTTRTRATRALGILRAKEAIPDLLQAAFSNNTELIGATLVAFEKIKDPTVGPRISFLLNYPQKDIQKRAASTLGVLKTESAIPDLVRLFQNNSDDKSLRAVALESLAFMPNKDTAPLFSNNINDKDKSVRASAALGLGRLKDATYLAQLEKALASEKDTAVRLALDFAIVNHGKMDSLPELIENLDSRIHSGEARPYLIELARDAGVRAALRNSLFSKNDDIRRNLCIVFGTSGDGASIPDLEVLSRDRKSDVAEEASRAIRMIRARGV